MGHRPLGLCSINFKEHSMKKKKKINRQKQKRKIQNKRKQNKILAAIGGDMRNLAVAVLGAGALSAVISKEPTNINLMMFLACGAAIWLCGILLTVITQE